MSEVNKENITTEVGKKVEAGDVPVITKPGEEAVGLQVGEKIFEFELPVSKLTVGMRYSTRKDKRAAFNYAGKGDEAEERYETHYLASIITINDMTEKLRRGTLQGLVEKDLAYLRVADNRVNNLSEEQIEKLTRDFATAQS